LHRGQGGQRPELHKLVVHGSAHTYIQGKRMSATAIKTSAGNGRGRGGIGREAHRIDACVLGKTGGGPEGPNFAGDPTGKRGRCLLFWADRVDSSCRNHLGSKAKAKAKLSRRGRAPGYGAMARWRWLCSGAWTRTPQGSGEMPRSVCSWEQQRWRRESRLTRASR
jgi:hypothetical protein